MPNSLGPGFLRLFSVALALLIGAAVARAQTGDARRRRPARPEEGGNRRDQVHRHRQCQRADRARQHPGARGRRFRRTHDRPRHPVALSHRPVRVHRGQARGTAEQHRQPGLRDHAQIPRAGGPVRGQQEGQDQPAGEGDRAPSRTPRSTSTRSRPTPRSSTSITRSPATTRRRSPTTSSATAARASAP